MNRKTITSEGNPFNACLEVDDVTANLVSSVASKLVKGDTPIVCITDASVVYAVIAVRSVVGVMCEVVVVHRHQDAKGGIEFVSEQGNGTTNPLDAAAAWGINIEEKTNICSWSKTNESNGSMGSIAFMVGAMELCLQIVREVGILFEPAIIAAEENDEQAKKNREVMASLAPAGQSVH